MDLENHYTLTMIQIKEKHIPALFMGSAVKCVHALIIKYRL